jgi:hypothetical protein
VKSETLYKDAACLDFECEGDFGCKLGATCTQFAPNFTDFASPNHPVTLLECMAGTTGLEPATSAVTEPPKSSKTVLFVDRIVDRILWNLRKCTSFVWLSFSAAGQSTVASGTLTPPSACPQKVGDSHSVVRAMDTAP